MEVLVLASVGALIAAPVIGGLAWRRARQRRVAKALEITTPDGIVEHRFVKIGGIDQWIQIRGENRANPVLLVLHGGPGWPNAVFTLPLRSWEQHFTVVQWDHRGAGKTLGRNGKEGSGEMTFERRVTDAIELIEFLRQYLATDKVIVLAESMGTLTGLPLIKRRPDLVHALVVTDLYVNMARNEAHKYQLTRDRLRAIGSPKGVTALDPATLHRHRPCTHACRLPACLIRTPTKACATRSEPLASRDRGISLPGNGCSRRFAGSRSATQPTWPRRPVPRWAAGWSMMCC